MNWEYRIGEGKDHKDFIGIAQDLGNDRWELIHVEIICGFTVGFFKRPAEQN